MSEKHDLDIAQKENVAAPLWKVDDLTITGQYIGFPLSLKRFAIILLCGAVFLNLHYLYLLCWGFKHFRSFIRSGTSGSIFKFICSYFLPFSLFALMNRYDQRAKARGIQLNMHKFLIPTLYFVLSMLWIVSANTGDLWSLMYKDNQPDAKVLDALTSGLDYLSLAPLFLFQHKVNQLNKALFPDKSFSPPPRNRDKALIAFFLIVGTALNSLGPLADWMEANTAGIQ